MIVKMKLAILLVTLCCTIADAQTPRRATGSAILSGGFVVGLTITDGGYGYTNAPLVHIIGGGGSNAVVTASVSNSIVIGITVNNPGIGYFATPQVSIAPPIIPLPQMVASPATRLKWTGLSTNTFGMYGEYMLMKNISGVWVNQQYTSGRGGSSLSSSDGTLALDFDSAPPHATYALGLFPTPVQAYATAQATNGFVTAINIYNYGLGYTVIPTVQIIGGGGTGAQVQASIAIH